MSGCLFGFLFLRGCIGNYRVSETTSSSSFLSSILKLLRKIHLYANETQQI